MGINIMGLTNRRYPKVTPMKGLTAASSTIAEAMDISDLSYDFLKECKVRVLFNEPVDLINVSLAEIESYLNPDPRQYQHRFKPLFLFDEW